MKLVVGLGNPGSRYARTRHNVGFLVLDKLAKEKGLTFTPDPSSEAEIAELTLENGTAVLVKPQTMMNLSGRAVRKLLESRGLSAEDVLVVSDDFNLPFGQLRIRQGGEDGGHNGLESIINAIGPEFWRFRIGISSGYQDIAGHSEFVVSPFSAEEQRESKHMVERAAELLEKYLVKGDIGHDTIRLV